MFRWFSSHRRKVRYYYYTFLEASVLILSTKVIWFQELLRQFQTMQIKWNLETRNLALNSTFVVQGKCTGVVFATGDRNIMGRIVAMSGETKFKLTTVQKEVLFFTKIISAVALSLFCIAMIVWAAWLRKSFPGFETASGAIINSIGCLNTAFVPQVRNRLS